MMENKKKKYVLFYCYPFCLFSVVAHMSLGLDLLFVRQKKWTCTKDMPHLP